LIFLLFCLAFFGGNKEKKFGLYPNKKTVQFSRRTLEFHYWVFQKGMYSLIGGKIEKASSAKNIWKIQIFISLSFIAL
jgi:hypothetical protein